MRDELGWYVAHNGTLVNLDNANAIYLDRVNGALVANFDGDTWSLEQRDKADVTLAYFCSKIRQDVT